MGDTASEAARGAGTPPTALTQRWAAGRGAHLTPGTSPAKSSFPWTLASSIKANGAQSALTSPPTVTGPLSGAAGYQARNATGERGCPRVIHVRKPAMGMSSFAVRLRAP